MTTHDWHASDAMLHAYTQGEPDIAAAASVEAHLMRCAACRARIPVAGTELLETAWGQVVDHLHTQPSPLGVRLLQRLGCAEHDAVLLAAARSLRGAWTLATVLVVAFAAIAAAFGASQGLALYLLVAPLTPVLGVVAAFGSTDPLADLTSATPYSKARLALVRTAAVVVTGVPVTIAIGALVPGIGWLALAWLMPALALTLGTLVALTWWPPEPVGVAVAVGWSAVIAATYASHDVAATVRIELQVIYLVLALLAALVLALRISTSSTPGGYA